MRTIRTRKRKIKVQNLFVTTGYLYMTSKTNGACAIAIVPAGNSHKKVRTAFPDAVKVTITMTQKAWNNLQIHYT